MGVVATCHTKGTLERFFFFFLNRADLLDPFNAWCLCSRRSVEGLLPCQTQKGLLEHPAETGIGFSLSSSFRPRVVSFWGVLFPKKRFPRETLAEVYVLQPAGSANPSDCVGGPGTRRMARVRLGWYLFVFCFSGTPKEAPRHSLSFSSSAFLYLFGGRLPERRHTNKT